MKKQSRVEVGRFNKLLNFIISNFMKSITILLVSCLSFFAGNVSVSAGNLVTKLSGGVVIGHSPKSTQVYIGSPSICVLDNGDYVASYNLNSTNPPYSTNPETWVYRSSDKGRTWQKVTQLVDQYYSQLFVHRGDLYILGTSKHAGAIIIRKSVDGGNSWTIPVSSTTGIIASATGKYHTAPTPVIIHNGRLWKAMEDVLGGGTVWGQAFRAFMMSVPEDADLLRASNWTFSTKQGYNANYLNGDFGGWLEGNAVVTPEGKVVNVLRTHYQKNGNELTSIISVSDDGLITSFNPQTGFVSFPGGCKKFAIRFDPQTNLYWSLSNFVPDSYKHNNIERTRNTLALLYSSDLINWQIKGIVLHHPDVNYHGFQYADFQFDGNDVIFVSRTAFDDGLGGADSQHNANYLTFHRIVDYNNYDTPEQWKQLLDNNQHDEVDIYIAGAIKNTVSKYTAGYWKNGVFTTLGEGNTTSYARSIFVSGNDVYVGGYEANDNGINVAKCWKNGIVTNYSDGKVNASIQSVHISGSDVYFAGYDNRGTTRVAICWKNGVPIQLGNRYSMAQSVFISGNDVYVSGNENNNASPAKSEAKYWKNGTAITLEGDASSNLYTTSIYVLNDDVYVAGYEIKSNGTNIPKYWKNGIAVNLSDGTKSTQPTATSVFVYNDDVYISGNEMVNSKDYIRYWKSSSYSDLGTSQGVSASYGQSVYVHDNNVFIAGYEGNIAKYWINGVASELNFPAAAFSIVVIDKTINSNNIIDGDKGAVVSFNSHTNELCVIGIQDKVKLHIYNLNGKLMIKKQISGNEVISLSAFCHGMYIVEVVTSLATSYYKIIKFG